MGNIKGRTHFNLEVTVPYKSTLNRNTRIKSDRPSRNTVITPDEVMNLIILLNTTDDVSEFLNKL